MSKPSPWGGYTIPMLIVFLGVIGLFDFIFFVAFLALLGYYLYRVEKRLTAIEVKTGIAVAPSDGKQVVQKEREVITKETVRVPCRYCGALVDNTATKCPSCGAKLR